jgi:PAS domain S-box-containing protein
MIPHEYHELFNAYLGRIRANGSDSGLMIVLTRSGERRTWEYNNTLRTEGVGSPVVRGMAHDITERRRAELALRGREEDYRRFVAQSSEGIFREDLDIPVPIDLPEDEVILRIRRDSYVSECNDALAKMYGFATSQEMVGKRLGDMLVPDDPENLDWMREYVRSGFHVLEQESHEVDRHGHPKVFLNSMIGIVEEGKLVRTWGIQRDVTERVRAEQERKKAEEALRASEREQFEIAKQLEVQSARLIEAQAVGNVGSWEIELPSLQVTWSEQTHRIFETGPSHFKPLRPDFVKLIHPEDRAKVDAAFAASLEKDTPSSIEYRIVLTDGRVKVLEEHWRVFHDEKGRPVRLVGTCQDITERKQAEEAFRQSEERFRVALKDSPITVFNQDRDLRYTWIFNPHPYWQHDVVGKTDAEIIGEENAGRLDDLKRRVLKTGVALREEVRIPHNGRSYAFDLTIEPLFDADGNVIGITGASMDIARLRELADGLQSAKEKLAHEKTYLESEIQTELGFEEIIGQSPALREVLKKARIVAPTDSTVLLLGETGTGKELVARSLHALSARHDKSFIKLNCAAVPYGLLESELFGHEKGAFTSAASQKIGRIELADKGTLFLDEVGELPL